VVCPRILDAFGGDSETDMRSLFYTNEFSTSFRVPPIEPSFVLKGPPSLEEINPQDFKTILSDLL
jgi:hypothetical protein